LGGGKVRGGSRVHGVQGLNVVGKEVEKKKTLIQNENKGGKKRKGGKKHRNHLN